MQEAQKLRLIDWYYRLNYMYLMAKRLSS